MDAGEIHVGQGLSFNSALNDTFVMAQPALSNGWIDSIAERGNVAAGTVNAYSKYFSRLHSVEDFIFLVDSFAGLLMGMRERQHQHVLRLVKAKELFVRWYVYTERNVGLLSDIYKHLEEGKTYGDGSNTLSKNDRLANFGRLGLPQYMPIDSMNKPFVGLRDMRHASGTFGIMYLDPIIPKERVEDHPVDFLGIVRQPVDFIHYANANGRASLKFNQGQIDYIVEQTLKFAYDIIAAAGSKEESEWNIRESQAVEGLQARIEAVKNDRSAVESVRNILDMVNYARAVEEGFLSFAVGWIRAVESTFKLH
jgi:hypothetical protein